MTTIVSNLPTAAGQFGIGHLFGEWTLISTGLFRSQNGDRCLLCRCVCGAERQVNYDNLVAGKTKSCGCIQRKHRKIEVGQVRGRLVVVEQVNGAWLCRCVCGTTTLRGAGELEPGKSPGAKCKICRARVPRYMRITLRNMIRRCHDTTALDYPNYGARGIVVCERWRQSAMAFYEDTGERPTPRHTIDRIDNDGNYEPTNCRWATRQEQSLNKRNNRRIEYDGKLLTVSEWTKLLDLPEGKILQRLMRGWTVEQALTLGTYVRVK